MTLFKLCLKRLNSDLILVLISIVSVSGFTPVYAQSLPTIDSSTHALFYKLGGGRAVPPPGSGYVTHRVTARIRASLGYSCGEFNFQENISQMINEWQSQIRAIPSQLQAALTAAVASLPSYLLKKINPSLYDVLTKSLDESAELFRLSYKSCEQIEREIRDNPQGYNPYDSFIQVSAATKWKEGVDSGENIADVEQEVKENPQGPIEWLGGNEYGTVRRPIQINHDLTIAGYNIMLGRTGDVSTNDLPMGIMAQQPIVQIWRRPSDAGIWLQDVVGDMVIITADTDADKDSITGEGLRQVVADLEPLIREALDEAVSTYDFTDINRYESLSVSSGLINGLRGMPLGERLVFMERLVSEMAVNEAYERVMLIRQMLLMGLNHPDNVAAKISDQTDQYVRHKTFPDLDVFVKEIYETLALKRSTVNSTAISIINQHNARKSSGIAESTGTGSPAESTNLIDGGIQAN